MLNLRGRIVTVIDLRRRLGLPEREGDGATMALGIEFKGESFGLLIDAVGEVLKLADGEREPNPVNLDARLARVASGCASARRSVAGRSRRRSRARHRR